VAYEAETLFLLAVSAAGASGVLVAGPKGERMVSATDLNSLPHTKVALSEHGKQAKFEGVAA
jgi:hypothetical protein